MLWPQHYPKGKRYAKQLGSGLTVLSMVGVVIVIVVSILFYRLAVKATLFKSSGNANDASTITAVTAALLNLIAIILLGKLYKSLAGIQTPVYPCALRRFELELFCVLTRACPACVQ